MGLNAKDTSYNAAALAYAILSEDEYIGVDQAISKIIDNTDYKITETDLQEMYQLHQSGLNMKEIARLFGLKYHIVYKNLVRYKNGIKKGLSEAATSSRPHKKTS